MAENPKKISNYNLQNAKFAGGLVDSETTFADQIGGDIHNYSPEQRKNLADAAAEIQQLLKQLEQTNPTATESVVTEAIYHKIKHNLTLKARLLAALKAGGLEALKQIFDHPLFSLPAETVRGWLETMLTNKEAIVNQIYEDWGNNAQSEICIEVLDYLLRTPADRICHITYGSLKIVVNKKYTDIDLLKAIQYLCGDRTKLLEINFEFIEDEENIFLLSNAEVKNAQSTGELVHPETGEIINDFKEKVFMYFEPSSLVKNITQ